MHPAYWLRPLLAWVPVGVPLRALPFFCAYLILDPPYGGWFLWRRLIWGLHFSTTLPTSPVPRSWSARVDCFHITTFLGTRPLVHLISAISPAAELAGLGFRPARSPLSPCSTYMGLRAHFPSILPPAIFLSLLPYLDRPPAARRHLLAAPGTAAV